MPNCSDFLGNRVRGEFNAAVQLSKPDEQSNSNTPLRADRRELTCVVEHLAQRPVNLFDQKFFSRPV